MKPVPRLVGIAACAAAILVASPIPSLAQAIESPPLVIRSNTQESTIWAQDRAGAPAENSVQSIQSTTGAGAQTGIVNATGGNTQLNATQAAQPTSILVQGDLPCEAESKSWTVGSQSCTATVPRTFSGQIGAGTDSTQPTTGVAQFACTNGAFAATPSTGATCELASCPAQVQSWSAGGNICAASLTALSHGQIGSFASTNGNVGSGSFTCNINTWVYNSGTCAPPGPPPPRVVFAAFGCTQSDTRWGCQQIVYYCSLGVPSSGPYAVASGPHIAGTGATVLRMGRRAGNNCYQHLYGINTGFNGTSGGATYSMATSLGFQANGTPLGVQNGDSGTVGQGTYSPGGWYWMRMSH